MKFLIIAVLVFAIGILSVECKGRITYGSIGKAHDFDYHVKIFIVYKTPNGTGSHFCGGSVIDEKWILSAAHCYADFVLLNVTVSLGLKVSNEYIQNITAVRVISHEGYQNTELTLLNDITLIEIPKVECMKYIRKIPLCRPGSFDGEYVTVSGEGLTENGTDATELRYAKLKVLNKTTCAPLFPIALADSQFCTFEETQNPCSGDSGGPLVIGYGKEAIQAGIVSYGLAVCSPNVPGVFTLVSYFLPWIESKTNLKFQTKRCTNDEYSKNKYGSGRHTHDRHTHDRHTHDRHTHDRHTHGHHTHK